jgi:hypothetical protein
MRELVQKGQQMRQSKGKIKRENKQRITLLTSDMELDGYFANRLLVCEDPSSLVGLRLRLQQGNQK